MKRLHNRYECEQLLSRVNAMHTSIAIWMIAADRFVLFTNKDDNQQERPEYIRTQE